MSSRIFSTACSLPSIASPDYDFIGGQCHVPAAPPPIFDCGTLTLPIDPPPILPPCPVIKATAAAEYGTVNGSIGADVTVTLTGSTSNCAFLFDFAFKLPPAVCPQLTVASTTTTVTRGTPSADVILTQIGSSSQCAFQFDFTFKLPEPLCPKMTVSATTAVVTTRGKSGADVTLTRVGSSSNCAFQFDFAFKLPPPICPKMTVATTTTVAVTRRNPGADVTLTQVGSSSNCAFQFDFAFKLPPPICPTMAITSTTKTLPRGMPATADVTLTQVGSSSNCAFQFDFAFKLPPPICPTLTATGQVEIMYGSSAGSLPVVDITVTPDDRNSLGSVCGFHFDFSFKLPAAPCPKFWAEGELEYGIGNVPGFGVYVTRFFNPYDPDGDGDGTDGVNPSLFDPNACNYFFDFQLSLPAPDPNLGGAPDIRFRIVNPDCTFSRAVAVITAVAAGAASPTIGTSIAIYDLDAWFSGENNTTLLGRRGTAVQYAMPMLDQPINQYSAFQDVYGIIVLAGGNLAC